MVEGANRKGGSQRECSKARFGHQRYHRTEFQEVKKYIPTKAVDMIPSLPRRFPRRRSDA